MKLINLKIKIKRIRLQNKTKHLNLPSHLFSRVDFSFNIIVYKERLEFIYKKQKSEFLKDETESNNEIKNENLNQFNHF